MDDLLIEKQIGKAQEFHKAGDLNTAEMIYHSVLDMRPDHADALHLNGLVAYQRGKTEVAINLIKKAIRCDPSNPLYYNNIGATLRAAGNLAEAESCYKKAIQLKPDYSVACYNLGNIYHTMGKGEKAIEFYKKALAINPEYVEAYVNLSAIFNTLGQYDDSVLCGKNALKINPNCADAYNNLGNAAKGLEKLDVAIGYFRKSIEIVPDNAEAYSNLGNALYDTGCSEEALESFKNAINIKPDYGEAYNNMGTVFRSQRRLSEAQSAFNKAISLKPGDPEAYHNMGNIYYDQGQYDAASTWYKKAIAIRPNMAESFIQLGLTMHWQGQSDASLSCFRKAEELDPENPRTYIHLIHEYQRRCEWNALESLNIKVDRFTKDALLNGKRPDEMPFLNLIRHSDIQMNYEVARAWSRDVLKRVANQNVVFDPGAKKPEDKRITIGYISNNFRNHATSHLVSGLFKEHNRDSFKICCYSYGEDDKSTYREQIRDGCDHFVDIKDMSHLEAAKRIRKDHVDILVDLVGYMKGNRMQICAARPAPIQIRWLGHAGTTGADFYDYIVTDPIVTPERFSPYFSERFIYMECYQINNRRQVISDENIQRQDIGLPADGFVFCSFCTDYKIEPVMFEVWMDILHQVPGSVLWLMKGNGVLEQNLRKEAEKCRIDPNRLVFAEILPKEKHLKRLQLADLALDTRVVNGAATTSDALWAGVPVLTLQGAHFASRMSSSILHAIGLAELVTQSNHEYKQLAVRLANDQDALSALRTRLADNHKTKTLFDTPGYVSKLEKAFKKIWKNYQDGQKPMLIRAAD